MQPAPQQLIIPTPLANCWREGRVICIDNLNCTRDVNNVKIHYKILRESFADAPPCWLKVFPDCEAFSLDVRELAAQELPQLCEAVAIVAPQVSMWGLVRSYTKVKDKGVKIKFFEDEREARRWLNLHC